MLKPWNLKQLSQTSQEVLHVPLTTVCAFWDTQQRQSTTLGLCMSYLTHLLFREEKVHQEDDKIKKEDKWYSYLSISSLHQNRSGTRFQMSTILFCLPSEFYYSPLLIISLFWHQSVLQLHWIIGSFWYRALLVSSSVLLMACSELQ